MTLEFEWDDNKNRINLDKHGLSFEEAITIFKADARLYRDFVVNGEQRQLYLGLAGGLVLILVVVTERGSRKRIISARIANRKERAAYYGY